MRLWWSPPDSPAECALQMVGRYKTREAAIQQAHAYDLDAHMDEERAYWRSVLAELRAYCGTGKVNGARFI
jgi:hypothetical protein